VRSASTTLLNTGVWYHLAVDKDSTGKIRLYVNGAVVGSATPANSTINHNAGQPVSIGCTGFGGNPLSGWVDEVRVTKGVARYKTDAGFTPPTHAFPRKGP
jgi:concanavalin A-like lectin/glucanase superfamily protein